MPLSVCFKFRQLVIFALFYIWESYCKSKKGEVYFFWNSVVIIFSQLNISSPAWWTACMTALWFIKLDKPKMLTRYEVASLSHCRKKKLRGNSKFWCAPNPVFYKLTIELDLHSQCFCAAYNFCGNVTYGKCF